MDATNILYKVVLGIVSAFISYVVFILKRDRDKVEKRLEVLEKESVEHLDEPKVRQMIRDMLEPTNVKIDDMQEDIKESREDTKYIRNKLDRLIEKL